MKLPICVLILLTCGMASAQLSHEAEARNAVIREKSQTIFEMLPLAYDASGKAPYHFIDPNSRYFLYEGYRYFGFRFRTPATIEGDFGWMYILRPKDGPVSVSNSGWYILRKNGPMAGFTDYQREKVADFPDVAALFPHTRNITLQTLRAENFLPNEEYVIWFMQPETEPRPEYAVVFSFAPRTKGWTARLPLGRKKIVPTKTTPTSIEGDPW